MNYMLQKHFFFRFKNGSTNCFFVFLKTQNQGLYCKFGVWTVKCTNQNKVSK